MSVGLTGDAHQAADALDHEIVAGLVAVRSSLTEPGDRAIHESRIARRERRIIPTVPGNSPALEILDQDVPLGGERLHEFLPLTMGEIDGHGALAAVGREKIG